MRNRFFNNPFFTRKETRKIKRITVNGRIKKLKSLLATKNIGHFLFLKLMINLNIAILINIIKIREGNPPILDKILIPSMPA